MEPIVNVTIKLKDLEFSLTTDEAGELHDSLSNLLGLKKVETDDLLKLADELIRERDKLREIDKLINGISASSVKSLLETETKTKGASK